MKAVITDHRILAGMERAGYIVRDGQATDRERHWTGAMVPVVTAHAGPKLTYSAQVFVYKGHEYRLRYIDGCFHPFVTRCDTPAPQFV